ncbi:hypothetical protein NC661_07010 [Aquibacillus koreensis]|uniref:Uncharacterized protein n=1 Tax=Aquibacillus koreensis TaxID=279446 RepID=A0A9X3WHN7_9BACI|nr:hypothetical protein [Aquibacillus koreensis]MCT2535598.1 hypothetical protein [Aquibacillus koreensis]MDC3420117.1 hypothetical protein [Aquibacillus koreensis]
MDVLSQLATDYPIWSILFVAIAVMFVISIVRSLFKMAMVVVVIGLVLVVFFDFEPTEVMDKGKEFVHTGKDVLENSISSDLLKALSEENFSIKKENGQTLIEVKSLGLSYNLNDLFEQLNNEQQHELEKLLEK